MREGRKIQESQDTNHTDPLSIPPSKDVPQHLKIIQTQAGGGGGGNRTEGTRKTQGFKKKKKTSLQAKPGTEIHKNTKSSGRQPGDHPEWGNSSGEWPSSSPSLARDVYLERLGISRTKGVETTGEASAAGEPDSEPGR